MKVYLIVYNSTYNKFYDFKTKKMKKYLLMFTLFATIVCSAQAQKIDAASVPAAVKAAFEKQFPTATAKWEKEDGKYEAGFKGGGEEMSALFTADGAMTESEVGMKSAALPAKVLSYVKQHYSGKSIKAGAKITKADGTVIYEAEVNGVDVLFDVDGNFLQEVKA
jgi:hypothetical protein